MAGDLGTAAGEVDSGVGQAAADVLDFWFAIPADKRFAKDEALDREIAARFGALRQRVHDSAAAGWRDDPRHLLAAVILLDQFSRNLFRGRAEAFAADPIARRLTAEALAKGWDSGMSPEERVFLYMPMMHGEDAESQRRSVELFTALGEEENLRFAIDHAEVFARFGRFPSRNAALGRATTAEEQAYLDAGGGW
jgi:uncharacterized protein (DUF924 family)